MLCPLRRLLPSFVENWNLVVVNVKLLKLKFEKWN